jgi:hypothetical protein
MVEEGLKASLSDDNLADYTLYFQQSLGDLSKKGERLWFEGPGRFPHPNSLEWRRKQLGNNFFEFRV